MKRIVFDVPEDSLLALKLAPEALAAELRLAAAVKSFELGRLFCGVAARLLELPRVVFLSLLPTRG